MKDNIRGWNRCCICGSFFSIREVIEGRIQTNFTPDTAFTQEEIRYYHKACRK